MDYNSEKQRIGNYDDAELKNLNEVLFRSIYGGTAPGFVNEMGHPAYRMGVDGAEEEIDDPVWGDGPEHNELYQLLKALYVEMDRRGIPVDRPIRSWSDFCSVVCEAYDQLPVK